MSIVTFLLALHSGTNRKLTCWASNIKE